jgi:hypothetical protein
MQHMPQKPRRKTPRQKRDVHFDILAHSKEIDRLLRENAKLKAQKLILERELALRPPLEPPTDSMQLVDEYKAKLEALRQKLRGGST